MHREILSPSQTELLPLLSGFTKHFYLVGGTAIALHIGHRRSIDFDLFTLRNLNHTEIKNRIRNTGFDIDSIIHESADQIHLLLKGVKITFFQFPFTVEANVDFEKYIHIPDLLSLAGMKAFALGGRAKWKDYVDLYFLLKHHFSLGEVCSKAKMIFAQNFNEKLFRQQLAWYNDIDYSETIEYLVPAPTDLEIKTFLSDIAIVPF